MPKNIMPRYLFLIIGISWLLLIVGCKEKSPEQQAVARVGKEEIRFADFLYDFTVFPQYRGALTLREARLQHLNQMADRALLYLAAEEDGLENTPEIQSRLRYIEHKEVLKRLYQKDVLDKIPASDEEAWEEYKRSNIQVKLRHLFAPTREEAEIYYRRLQSGESLETLARETFMDSALAGSGGDLGFVSIPDLDPFLADSVYNLRIGEVSHPLRSSFGYHIMRVEDVKQSVFLSREYFTEHKEEYLNSLRTRRARVRSAEYLAAKLKGKSVTIKTAVMRELLDFSKGYIQVRRRETPLPMPQVTDGELQNLAGNAGELLDRALVEFNGDHWTVGQFLVKLQEMPPLHRPSISNENALARHLIDMARDELLLREAYRRGIHKDKELRETVAQWRKQLLADEFKKRIYWVDYQQEDPVKWQARKTLYQTLQNRVPVSVDTTLLFHDLSEAQLQQRIPALPTVIREYYVW